MIFVHGKWTSGFIFDVRIFIWRKRCCKAFLLHREDILTADIYFAKGRRIAIGRALITRPALILADEPTGNLDTQNSREVIGLLKEASKKYEQTIIRNKKHWDDNTQKCHTILPPVYTCRDRNQAEITFHSLSPFHSLLYRRKESRLVRRGRHLYHSACQCAWRGKCSAER